MTDDKSELKYDDYICVGDFRHDTNREFCAMHDRWFSQCTIVKIMKDLNNQMTENALLKRRVGKEIWLIDWLKDQGYDEIAKEAEEALHGEGTK